MSKTAGSFARWRLATLGLFVLLGGSSTLLNRAEAQAAAAPQTWAIVVGVDKYDLDTITPLRYAGSDAKLLAETLRSTMKTPAANIFLFTNDSPDQSQRPTLPNIVFRMDWLERNVSPRDTVVFYFAGHGVTMDGETYMMTKDSDNRSKVTLTASALNSKALAEELSSIPAANTLVMLDSCRNDPTRGRGEVDNRLTEEAVRGLVIKPVAGSGSSSQGTGSGAHNTCTIFACGVGQRSWEWADRQHGFFTYEVVEGLKTAADSKGCVTLGTLASFVQKAVKENTLRNATAVQTPIVRYDGPGVDQWVLCDTGKRPPTAAEETAASARVRVRGKYATTKTKASDLWQIHDPDEADHF